MSSPGYQPDDRSPAGDPAPTPLAAPPPEERQELMERVLAETLAAEDEGSSVGEDVVQALRGVARRRAGQALEPEPAVVELVQAVLAPRFPALADQRDQWSIMTSRIADTLWEDPVSRQRLQSLWSRLQEGEVE